ncbi:MAG: metalloregulator ArsR/SmtB family transcription factor [Kiritimatiellae bacterium]|nr:metalloregulator ArsR/SmtB family transcription factor [Kiritimatiellia bacterium]MDW8458235.1 metalloregulator ArsR/SmtB family transcription factor [Verrucomicrobiota bacterium]
MISPLDLFRALSDEIRLRLVHAVMISELSVAELVEILELPQSTISRHLKPLRDTGLLETRREGTSIYYRPGEVLRDPSFAALLEKYLADLKTAARDAQSVRDALDRRRAKSREFFDNIAGRYSEWTQPGGGWPALAAGLAAGFMDRTVADLGCGDGTLAILLAYYARCVYAVDQSPAMLRQVCARARRAGVEDRIRTAEGDLERTTLVSASCDDVILSQALHHAARPAHAIREAARLLKPGGRLIVLDLARHDQEWVRIEWADQWLGFEEKEIRDWMEVAGLSVQHIRRLEPATGSGRAEFSAFIAVGLKPVPSAASTKVRSSSTLRGVNHAFQENC